MEKLKKVFWFLRLLDEDGKLSLTNIAVWIALIHLCFTKNMFGATDLAGFLGSLTSYQAKRFISQKDT